MCHITNTNSDIFELKFWFIIEEDLFLIFLAYMCPKYFPKTNDLCLCLPYLFLPALFLCLAYVILRTFSFCQFQFVHNLHGKVIYFSTQVKCPLRKISVGYSQESQLHLLVSIVVMCLLLFWVVCLIFWISKASLRAGLLSVLYWIPLFKCKNNYEWQAPRLKWLPELSFWTCKIPKSYWNFNELILF